jgi:hypothetical protein
VEEQDEVEEQAEQICSICYDAVDGSKSCRFACCMHKSFHIECVQQANLPSLTAYPDCGTTPDTMPADPDVMAEGMTAIAAEFQSIAADLVRPRPTSSSMVWGYRGRSLRCARCRGTQLAEVPSDEREALFAELCANDDGEPDVEGASKRAQFLSLLATESAGAPAHPTSSFHSPFAGRGGECGCVDSRGTRRFHPSGAAKQQPRRMRWAQRRCTPSSRRVLGIA